jgi:hypothetical protein
MYTDAAVILRAASRLAVAFAVTQSDFYKLVMNIMSLHPAEYMHIFNVPSLITPLTNKVMFFQHHKLIQPLSSYCPRHEDETKPTWEDIQWHDIHTDFHEN